MNNTTDPKSNNDEKEEEEKKKDVQPEIPPNTPSSAPQPNVASPEK